MLNVMLILGSTVTLEASKRLLFAAYTTYYLVLYILKQFFGQVKSFQYCQQEFLHYIPVRDMQFEVSCSCLMCSSHSRKNDKCFNVIPFKRKRSIPLEEVKLV